MAEYAREVMRTHEAERDRIDWREQVRNHPLIFIGAAAGLGIIVGAMLAPGSDRSENHYSEFGEPPARRGHIRQALQTSPKVAQLKTTWQHVSDALLGLATAKAVDAIAEVFPGFKDEYQRHASRMG